MAPPESVALSQSHLLNCNGQASRSLLAIHPTTASSSIHTALLADVSPPASASPSDAPQDYPAAQSLNHNCPSLEERNNLLGPGHTFHPLDMPTAYALRDGGDAKNKKQSMADLKLRRLNELNLRLKEDLDRPRIKVAEASIS
jgi:hypothetical protein